MADDLRRRPSAPPARDSKSEIGRALHPAVTPAAGSSDRQWHSLTRAYRAPHRNDWLILAFFAALPLLTGLDIGHQLGWNTSEGRLAMLLGLVTAALWAAIYFALKIAVVVRVSERGLGVRQGPWHGEIAWREMVRLSERARPTSLAAERWIVAEAADGRRLTIPAASLADYEGFVRDVNATFTDWRTHTAHLPHDAPWLEMPFLATERPLPAAWLLASGAGVGAVGSVLLLIAHGWSWTGVVLIVVGSGLAYLGLRRRLTVRTMQLNAHGVEVRSPIGAASLNWGAVSGVERGRGSIPLTARLAGSVLRQLLSTDRWTGGMPWAMTAPAELVVKGAGKRLRIRLDRIEAPDELLAHLDAWLRLVAQTRVARPPVRRITRRLATIPKPTAPLDVDRTLPKPPDGESAG